MRTAVREDFSFHMMVWGYDLAHLFEWDNEAAWRAMQVAIMAENGNSVGEQWWDYDERPL